MTYVYCSQEEKVCSGNSCADNENTSEAKPKLFTEIKYYIDITCRIINKVIFMCIKWMYVLFLVFWNENKTMMCSIRMPHPFSCTYWIRGGVFYIMHRARRKYILIVCSSSIYCKVKHIGYLPVLLHMYKPLSTLITPVVRRHRFPDVYVKSW